MLNKAEVKPLSRGQDVKADGKYSSEVEAKGWVIKRDGKYSERVQIPAKAIADFLTITLRYLSRIWLSVQV